MSYKIFNALGRETTKGAALLELAQADAGTNESVSVVFTGPLVDGDWITFGGGTAVDPLNKISHAVPGKKFWVKLLAAGTATLTDASLNSMMTGKPVVTINSHNLTQGQVFGVGTEFFRVLSVLDSNSITVLRGYAGSPVTAHAIASPVLVAANYSGPNLLADAIIPVTALAVATAGPQIASALVALDGFQPKSYGDFGAGYLTSKNAMGLSAEWIATGTRLFIARKARGNFLGVTLGMANATLSSPTLASGVEVGELRRSWVVRAPSAAEVTAGYMDFSFPWPVKFVTLVGEVTATGAPATLGGAVTYSADRTRVTLTNGGANNFAATNTVVLDVFG